jgi:hypothetical protein
MRPFFARRPPPPPPAPPEGSPEADLLAACQAADVALKSLSLALAARRQALIRLSARTKAPGKGFLNRLVSPSTLTAAIAAQDAIPHFHLAHVLTEHRRTLTESALSAIDASATYRQTLTPAEPGPDQEMDHAEAL